MQIDIETTDYTLPSDVMGGANSGDTVDVPGGATFTYQGMTLHETIGFPEVASFLLQHVDALATGLVGAWVYDKVKGRAKLLRINKRVVRIDKVEITRTIEEIVKEEK